MAKQIVKVACWNKSHVTDLFLNRTQEEKLDRQIGKLKKVCPNCKPDNKPIVIIQGATLFSPLKGYKCSKGHLHLLGLMGDLIHVKFGSDNDQFFNISGELKDIGDLIAKKDIACQFCKSKLKPIDDFALSVLQLGGIRTKTRIGDLWDKKGIEPVRSGHYDKNGNYSNSRTQKANEHRLRAMRKRAIPSERLPGTPIRKATKREYDYKEKSEVNPERLK